MIDSRVGSRVSTILGSKLGSGGDDEGTNGGQMFLIIGDSNGVGEAVTDKADPAFNVTVPQNFTFDAQYAQAAANPPTYQFISGQLRPYAVGGVSGMGLELTLAPELQKLGFTPVETKFAISGTTCAQWQTGSTYPTGTNVWNQMVTRTHQLEAQYGAKVAGVVVSLSTNDANTNPDTTAFQSNMTAMIAALRATFPGVKIAWLKIHPSTGAPNTATVSAAQVAAFTADPTFALVDTSDMVLLSDLLHYSSDSCLSLGQRCAYALGDLLSITRSKPATFVDVVGFGPATAGPGAATPASWGGAQAGDLEVLVAMSLTASGTNNAITTPSGWTLLAPTAVTATGGGSTTRQAMYSRVVDAAMLTGNSNHTAPTSIAAANTINSARIYTLRGPNANPTIDVTLGSNNASFTTALTLTGVTTGNANETVVQIGGGFRTTIAQNPATFVSTLTNLKDVQEANRDNGDSNFITINCWTGTKVVAGATGSVACTFALNTLATGALIAVKP
jgi:hypothetical protein